MMCSKSHVIVLRIACICIAASISSLGFIHSRASWSTINTGIQESQVCCIAVYPHDTELLLAGTTKAIYRSDDFGKTFNRVFLVPGSQKRVNYLYIEGAASAAYAATDSGLFESRDLGKTWDMVYSSRNERERRCYSVIDKDNTIYVATLGGLICAQKNEWQWRRCKGVLSSEPVFHSVRDAQHVYFSTGSEVYRFTGKEFTKVFSLVGHEINGDIDTDVILDSEFDVTQSNQVRFLSFSNDASNRLCAATVRGVYCSEDSGESWNTISSNGLPVKSATSMTTYKDTIFLGTRKGVFRYQDKDWEQIYKGMATNVINYLAADTEGVLYAATENGVYALEFAQESERPVFVEQQSVAEAFRYEPTIQEVQQLAIEYAEVNSDKIHEWRRLAKTRAWLPKVTIGLDGDRNKTMGDSVWGTYSTGGQDYVGPDDKTFYDNLGWDVSLSWDLSDLVWSTDQTTIDSRSKLMVELREDVLDQVTRLYFERRRLQMTFSTSDKSHAQEKIDLQMRIDELTALIDAFTGQKFSRKIAENKNASDQEIY